MKVLSYFVATSSILQCALLISNVKVSSAFSLPSQRTRHKPFSSFSIQRYTHDSQHYPEQMHMRGPNIMQRNRLFGSPSSSFISSRTTSSSSMYMYHRERSTPSSRLFMSPEDLQMYSELMDLSHVHGPSLTTIASSAPTEVHLSLLEKLHALSYLLWDCILTITGIKIVYNIILQYTRPRLEGVEKYDELRSAMIRPGDLPQLYPSAMDDWLALRYAKAGGDVGVAVGALDMSIGGGVAGLLEPSTTATAGAAGLTYNATEGYLTSMQTSHPIIATGTGTAAVMGNSSNHPLGIAGATTSRALGAAAVSSKEFMKELVNRITQAPLSYRTSLENNLPPSMENLPLLMVDNKNSSGPPQLGGGDGKNETELNVDGDDEIKVQDINEVGEEDDEEEQISGILKHLPATALKHLNNNSGDEIKSISEACNPLSSTENSTVIGDNDEVKPSLGEEIEPELEAKNEGIVETSEDLLVLTESSVEERNDAAPEPISQDDNMSEVNEKSQGILRTAKHLQVIGNSAESGENDLNEDDEVKSQMSIDMEHMEMSGANKHLPLIGSSTAVKMQVGDNNEPDCSWDETKQSKGEDEVISVEVDTSTNKQEEPIKVGASAAEEQIIGPDQDDDLPMEKPENKMPESMTVADAKAVFDLVDDISSLRHVHDSETASDDATEVDPPSKTTVGLPSNPNEASIVVDQSEHGTTTRSDEMGIESPQSIEEETEDCPDLEEPHSELGERKNLTIGDIKRSESTFYGEKGDLEPQENRGVDNSSINMNSDVMQDSDDDTPDEEIKGDPSIKEFKKPNMMDTSRTSPVSLGLEKAYAEAQAANLTDAAPRGEDLKMAQGLAEAAFHAELQKQSDEEKEETGNAYKSQIELDMIKVREYAAQKKILKQVAREQQTPESILLQRLAEKERRKKFNSIGLIDPRLKTPSTAKLYERMDLKRKKEVEAIDQKSTPDSDPKSDVHQESIEHLEEQIQRKVAFMSSRARSPTQVKEKSMFSLLKKRSVIFSAAALVMSRRILQIWMGSGLY